MQASSNLPQPSTSRKPLFGKTGVLTLTGFGIKARMQRGHLEIEDGVGMNRRKIRLARIGHSLRRLVCLSEDGFVTLSALKWLSEVGASFVMLTSTGKLSLITGPARAADAHLRRAQGLALTNGVALDISRTLIDAKLQGQEQVMRETLNDSASAQIIASYREKLASADSFDDIRKCESQAALIYFGTWRNLPVQWPKADSLRIPDHWRTAGNRQSPLTGGPRLAVTPVHALLNYCFGLLEAETRIAVAAMGLDACLGLGLHADTSHRDSLVFDVLEPVRPQVESWVLRWIRHEHLSRTDFFETSTGNCRLRANLCVRLGETAPTWGKLIAPWAEYVARTLWAEAKSGRSHNPVPPTRLTQQRRIEAKGKVWIAAIEQPKADHLCRGCGKAIAVRRSHCSSCSIESATTRMVDVARLGRLTANSPQANRKRAHIARQNATTQHAWVASRQPRWLTDQVYSQKIQPLLASISASVIASSIGVSRCYASNIRKGRFRPHPRHWLALAQLAGVVPGVPNRPNAPQSSQLA